MITATCKNQECSQHEIECHVLGNPSPIECGTCNENCELTDERDDPAELLEP
jgi:hypothetical protein